MGANHSDRRENRQPAESDRPISSFASRENCPLCGAATRLAFVHDGYPIRDCSGCGHRFAGFLPAPNHIEEVYGDDYFRGGGAGYPDYTAEAKLLRATGERYGMLLGRYSERRAVGSRLLDVGAAAGFVLDGCIRTGWDGEGVEPNRRMADYARTELGRTVHCGTLESVPFAKPFNALSFVQVLAHLPEPMETFRAADAVTKPGGLWLIETWNAASRTARLLGSAWHEYSPPSVLHWWTPKVLKTTLNGMGYRLRGTGFAQKWIGVGHAQSLIEHKYGTGWPTRIAWLFPKAWKLPYPSEDLFWAVYQKPR